MATAAFDPGGMTARLTLEAPVDTPDGQGGATVTWSAVAGLWARIEPVTASVGEEAGGWVTITHAIWMRHRGDVSSGMRLVKGGRVFVVETAHDPDESGRYLLCRCREEGR
ncbi:phage head closure protein [Ciceribacter azotifigens]|uniref:phage head closure protein n=1 Tax=Ciceribacter azotifigens TaxID=2069303 RepID=UPI003A83A342